MKLGAGAKNLALRQTFDAKKTIFGAGAKLDQIWRRLQKFGAGAKFHKEGFRHFFLTTGGLSYYYKYK